MKMRKLLSVLLAFAMVFSALGITAFAEDETAVAKVGDVEYSDIQEAIKAAAPDGTVEIVSDVTVDTWVMFSQTKTIGNGNIITLDMNGLTIKGNGHSLTVNSIESAKNGDYLFDDATNLNIYDLTINITTEKIGGIHLETGIIDGVTFNGGNGVFPGEGEITINDCEFNTDYYCIYYESARDNLTVTNNIFDIDMDLNVILLRGNETFTGNTINSGRTVNVVSGSPVVSGNTFADGVRFKVYNQATATISNNTLTYVVFEDDTTVLSTFENNTLSEDAKTALREAGVIESWDGVTISNLAELKKFRDAVNAGDNYAGKTVTLTSDIDLDENGDGVGEEWIPIGTSSAPFNGTFDGGNYTISNLVITGNNSDVGLFGRTNNGEIKNLEVQSAQVSGYLNVGAFAGTPYTSKYTNIKLSGHVEIDGFAYVGGIGGKNAYANWTDITVDVDETSYVNANSVSGDSHYRSYVGGVIGFIGEGGHKFTNITSNIDVKGSTCDIGGITGIAHYGNSFINCSASGDVEIYNAQEAGDALEVGGIAGVWHNQAGQTVTFDGCSFTGELKSNIEVEFPNGGLIGAAYNSTNADKETSGSLVIDEKIVWPVPELPTATVTELEKDDLTFALNFKADEVTDEQLEYYKNWYADFVLTVNKDITFNADGGADGYLSGQYDAWSENWVNVPFEDVTLEAGESIKIMEYAMELMGEPGLKLTYNDVYSFVKDFNCGVFLEPEFIAANQDLEITLELRMFNPEDESISYVIGETYNFVAPTQKPSGFLYTMYAIDMPTKTVDGRECYQFGMFAGIDSLNYREVGFKYSLDEIENATGKLATTTVYTEIIADNGTFTPKNFGDAEYIFAHYLWLPVRQDFDYSKTPITFNAYAIDMDGNEIDGRSFTVEEIVTK